MRTWYKVHQRQGNRENQLDPRLNDGLVIDHVAYDVRLDGQRISLTRTEFALLALLYDHPHHAQSSELLVSALWDTEWVGDLTALHTQVSRLRTKLGESGDAQQRIVTVHGFGYRYEPQVPKSPASKDKSVTTTSAGAELKAFALVALDRRFIWVGGDFQKLLGWTDTDLLGEVIYGFIHPEDRVLALGARAGLDAGIPTAIRFRMILASGGYRYVEVYARPLIGSDNTVHVFLGEFRGTRHEDIGHLPAPDPLQIPARWDEEPRPD